jgi:hypothetical protein
MPNGFTVVDFDRAVQRQQERAPSKEFRQTRAGVINKRVSDRLRMIMEQPVMIATTDEHGKSVTVTLPVLEAMTTKMVEMALGKGEFVGTKDHTRVQAYKAVLERVYGAPQQHIEHTVNTGSSEGEDFDSLSDEQLETLQRAHEAILSQPVTKLLG